MPTAQRIPFTVPALPSNYVKRWPEFDTLLSLLLGNQQAAQVAITTALQGGGGFGKTTLAIALCHDQRIRQHFSGGVLWITFGEQPDVIGLLVEQIRLLTDEPLNFSNLNTATARFRDLLAERRMLIVLDDLWEESPARPFLEGGPGCACLITTRRQDVAVRLNAQQPVSVNQMQINEAVEMLIRTLNAPPSQAAALTQLAHDLGEWPLLINLAGGYLRVGMAIHKLTLGQALDDLRERLHAYGFTAFDRKDEAQRNAAIGASLEVSVSRLGEQQERFMELAVFQDDVNIPVETLFRLWGTVGFSPVDAKSALRAMQELSLFNRYYPHPSNGVPFVRLHDVIHAWIREQHKDLPALHRKLLDVYRLAHWADLPDDEPYLWDFVAYHLVEAGRGEELVETVKDLRYLVAKTYARTAFAVERDLIAARALQFDDEVLRWLTRYFTNIAHMLGRCTDFNEVASTLYCRLQHLPELAKALSEYEQQLPRPYITLWHPLPDLPHPALIRTVEGHTSGVHACAISPDGKWFLSASADGTLKMWNAFTGSLHLTLKGHKGGVMACAFSPDGKWILSGSYDRTLKIWDATTGLAYLNLEGHTSSVTACAISLDGKWLLSASDDRTLKVWDAATGKLYFTLRGHTEEMTACAISPDGKWILSASEDSTLKLWDATTGQTRFNLDEHWHAVTACAFSPDGKWLLSGSADCTLKMWNAFTGSLHFTLKGHRGGVNACAFSPDGKWLLSASSDNSLIVWDATAGRPQLILEGHTLGVKACAISPDGKWLLSASDDNTVKMWDATASQIRLTPERHRDWVNACAISPDGKHLLSASFNHTLQVWDATTGLSRLTLEGHTDNVHACAISLDGKWLLSASWDTSLILWDATTGRPHLTLKGHTHWVNACAISPDGKWLLSASWDTSLILWDATTGRSHLTLKGHTHRVNACAISPDGKRLLSASEDHTLKIWDAMTGLLQLTLEGHTGSVSACAFSPDGSWLLSASWDNTLKVWDATTGLLQRTLEGHTDWVNACAFGPDGLWFLSTSEDKTLKLWSVDSGACLTTFHANGGLLGCAVHPDGKHIVAVGYAGIYWLQLVR